MPREIIFDVIGAMENAHRAIGRPAGAGTQLEAGERGRTQHEVGYIDRLLKQF
jgi:hypothetical protein